MKCSHEPVIDKCRLCLETKELRFSHIISKFFFRKMRHGDPSNKAVYLSMGGEEGKVEYVQDTWQEYLLCVDCEARLEKYETYVSELLYHPKASAPKHVDTDKKRILRGIQPEKFKLFQLSILWRAGVSSLSIFNRIRLTSDEQEFLRRVLLGVSPYLYEQFWCDLITYYDRAKLLKESVHVIIQPTFEIRKGQVFYHFVFGGYVWSFYMRNLRPKAAKVMNFRDNGKYIVPKQDFFKIGVIHETIKEAARMGLFTDPKRLRAKNKH